MSWFWDTYAQQATDASPSRPDTDRQPARPRRRGLGASLAEQVGRRVTLLWRCGPAVATATGWIVKVDRNVVEIRGAVRMLSEAAGRMSRRPGSVAELNTVVPLRSVCGWIEDVPRGVRALIPLQFGPGRRSAAASQAAAVGAVAAGSATASAPGPRTGSGVLGDGCGASIEPARKRARAP